MGDETSQRCACGRPLHYLSGDARAFTERMISELGAEMEVTTPDGSWWVPRHYIALHGLHADELPALAARLGFRAVVPRETGHPPYPEYLPLTCRCGHTGYRHNGCDGPCLDVCPCKSFTAENG